MEDMKRTHPGLDEILRRVQQELEKAGGLRALARKWKLSAPYISDVLRCRRHPGPSILKHFGLVALREVIVRYEPKGKKA